MKLTTIGDPALEDAVSRYLDLLAEPLSARVLLPLVRKGLHFRLFLSKAGAIKMLREAAQRRFTGGVTEDEVIDICRGDAEPQTREPGVERLQDLGCAFARWVGRGRWA